MNSNVRTVDMTISIQTVKDLIETWLRTTSFISDSEDVTIKFDYNSILQQQDNKLLPLTLNISTGVISIKFYG